MSGGARARPPRLRLVVLLSCIVSISHATFLPDEIDPIQAWDKNGGLLINGSQSTNGRQRSWWYHDQRQDVRTRVSNTSILNLTPQESKYGEYYLEDDLSQSVLDYKLVVPSSTAGSPYESDFLSLYTCRLKESNNVEFWLRVNINERAIDKSQHCDLLLDGLPHCAFVQFIHKPCTYNVTNLTVKFSGRCRLYSKNNHYFISSVPMRISQVDDLPLCPSQSTSSIETISTSPTVPASTSEPSTANTGITTSTTSMTTTSIASIASDTSITSKTMQPTPTSGATQSTPTPGATQSTPTSGATHSTTASGATQSTPTSGATQSTTASGATQSTTASGATQSTPTSGATQSTTASGATQSTTASGATQSIPTSGATQSTPTFDSEGTQSTPENIPSEQTKIFFIAVGSVTTTIAAIIILIIFLSLTVYCLCRKSTKGKANSNTGTNIRLHPQHNWIQEIEENQYAMAESLATVISTIIMYLRPFIASEEYYTISSEANVMEKAKLLLNILIVRKNKKLMLKFCEALEKANHHRWTYLREYCDTNDTEHYDA